MGRRTCFHHGRSNGMVALRRTSRIHSARRRPRASVHACLRRRWRLQRRLERAWRLLRQLTGGMHSFHRLPPVEGHLHRHAWAQCTLHLPLQHLGVHDLIVHHEHGADISGCRLPHRPRFLLLYVGSQRPQRGTPACTCTCTRAAGIRRSVHLPSCSRVRRSDQPGAHRTMREATLVGTWARRHVRACGATGLDARAHGRRWNGSGLKPHLDRSAHSKGTADGQEPVVC
mmetsp:Transcript_11211/g.35703  ORF Transcript_11211/g.35703 Transcript_11211/m.35703 type:complete len:229 (-) Transcript_11211:2775-3461(-)